MARRKTAVKPPRTRLESDERRAQLLALGLSVFSERPYDEISIDELAKAAKISKGLVYHYFPTKRDFYIAALELAAAQLRELTRTEADMPPLERLRRGLDSYHTYVSRHGAHYAALLRGGVGSDKEIAKIVDEIRDDSLHEIVRALGLEPPSALLWSALRGWIGFLEVTVLDWLEHRRVDRVALRELQVEVLLGVLRAALGSFPV